MSQIINDNELQIIRIERDKQFFTISRLSFAPRNLSVK